MARYRAIGGQFANLLKRPAEEIPEVLGFLYPSTLELGSFMELDQQLAMATGSHAQPLDPEVRRPLADLVRTLAPWLRNFPSVREADDEASRFLVKATEIRPAIDVVRYAREHDILDVQAAEVMRQLEEAAVRGGFQSEKAASRTRRSASNLVVGVAAFAGTFFVGAVSSDYATTSPLVHRVGQFLTRSEVAITELVSDLPADLRYAITDFVRTMSQHPHPPPTLPTEL